MRNGCARRFIVLVLAILGLTQEAFTSKIVYKDISFQELASSAAVVVQAVYQADAQKEKKDGGYAFKVEGIWTSVTPSPVPGELIRVWQTHAEAWGVIRRRAEQTGQRESLIVPALKPAGTLVSGQTYVLFLHEGVQAGEFVFDAENGFISSEAFKKEVHSSPRFRWRGESPKNTNP